VLPGYKRESGPKIFGPNQRQWGSWVLKVGTLLEQRGWFRVRLAPWRLTQWQNHYRDFMHGPLAAAHNNPGDEDDAEVKEPDKKIVSVILNQAIQELRKASDIEHRVIHINSFRLIWFVPHFPPTDF